MTENILTIHQWLQHARAMLANSTSPQLDAELLACHVLDWDRATLQLHLDEELSEIQLHQLDEILEERSVGKPMAYILGHQSFLDFEVEVDKAVLIPRPETETIVKKAIEIAQEKNISTVYEIGTGSGAIAIGLARALPDTKIIASDISPKALEIAKKNIDLLKVQDRVELVQSDLGEHIHHAELLVTNLPYLPDNLKVDDNLRHEPDVALWSGRDGLDHYKKLFSSVSFDTAVIELGAHQYIPLSDWISQNLTTHQVEQAKGIDGEIVGMIISRS